jgi:hypothetical protein
MWHIHAHDETQKSTFVSAIFAVDRTWKQTKCSSVLFCINSYIYMYIQVLEYYTTMKKNEVQLYTMMRKNSKIIVLT